MNKEKNLTIVIIAGNAQKHIKDCLLSCSFAGNIILVAANSTDDTKNIAKNVFPDIQIFETTDEYNRNFSKWRNIGYQNTHTTWLLYIDTDERIPPSLRDEIINVINSSQDNSYYVIPRSNHFLGVRVKHGGSYPDYVKRLYRMKDFQGYQGYLHEEPLVSGSLGYLKEDLDHYTHERLDSMLDKSLVWTDMEAYALYEAKHPLVVWWRIIRMMLTKLFERLILQGMWKDGMVGWISAIFEMFDTFIIYSRLWEIQTKSSK